MEGGMSGVGVGNGESHTVPAAGRVRVGNSGLASRSGCGSRNGCVEGLADYLGCELFVEQGGVHGEEGLVADGLL